MFSNTPKLIVAAKEHNMERRFFMTVLLLGSGLFQMLVLQSAAQADCTFAPGGLIAWWPGNGDLKDIVGGHDASAEGDVCFSEGKVGDAFCFGSEGGWLVVGDPPELDLTGDFTIVSWVKRDDMLGPAPTQDKKKRIEDQRSYLARRYRMERVLILSRLAASVRFPPV